MKPGRGGWAFLLVVLVLLAGAWWSGLVRQNFDVAMTSRSMSHARHDLPGVLDPGEKISVEPVLRRADVVTMLEGRQRGHRVAGDWGDVVSFEAVHGGEGTRQGIVHRAIAWVEYNATADAYDVPDLGLRGVRVFVVPDVGTWDPMGGAYVHLDMPVHLDPARAGRHDGFLTKGDNNPAFEQEAGNGLSGIGDVHLVAVERIDGKVAGWLEPHESLTLALWAAGGTLVLAMAWLAARRALRGRRLPLAGGALCGACGRRVAREAPFCPACGALPGTRRD